MINLYCKNTPFFTNFLIASTILKEVRPDNFKNTFSLLYKSISQRNFDV